MGRIETAGEYKEVTMTCEQPWQMPTSPKCECAAADLTATAQLVHEKVLREFARTGRSPSVSALSELANTGAADIDAALDELASTELVLLDGHGEVRCAYPFSGRPTAHRVQIVGGPLVHAMCAIDALGISAMLDKPVTIHSGEPDTGSTVVVSVDGPHAEWDPPTAVVFAGATDDCSTPSAERTCPSINFFTSAERASRWAGHHPEISGVVLDPRQAVGYGVAQFGSLLQVRF